jgi:hypothetical protein
MTSSTRKLSTLATASVAFALSAAAIAADAPAGSTGRAIGRDDVVRCYGVHACKGQSDCSTTEHACKGQNACKGHGYKVIKAGECLAKDGTIADIG